MYTDKFEEWNRNNVRHGNSEVEWETENLLVGSSKLPRATIGAYKPQIL